MEFNLRATWLIVQQCEEGRGVEDMAE